MGHYGHNVKLLGKTNGFNLQVNTPFTTKYPMFPKLHSVRRTAQWVTTKPKTRNTLRQNQPSPVRLTTFAQGVPATMDTKGTMATMCKILGYGPNQAHRTAKRPQPKAHIQQKQNLVSPQRRRVAEKANGKTSWFPTADIRILYSRQPRHNNTQPKTHGPHSL
jgi:hypothetical protein